MRPRSENSVAALPWDESEILSSDIALKLFEQYCELQVPDDKVQRAQSCGLYMLHSLIYVAVVLRMFGSISFRWCTNHGTDYELLDPATKSAAASTLRPLDTALPPSCHRCPVHMF